MKKWEYKAITTTAESSLINISGTSGWEVYAVVSHSANSMEGYLPSKHICTFFLKRELVDKQVIL